jgi:hypothetical protein
MEVAYSSKTLVTTYKAAQYYYPEDQNLNRQDSNPFFNMGWEELITYFPLHYILSDMTRTAQKTPHPTVFLLLHVYLLTQECVHPAVA